MGLYQKNADTPTPSEENKSISEQFVQSEGIPVAVKYLAVCFVMICILAAAFAVGYMLAVKKEIGFFVRLVPIIIAVMLLVGCLDLLRRIHSHHHPRRE